MAAEYYESDKIVSEYLAFHYGKTLPPELSSLPIEWALDFPKRCAKLASNFDSKKRNALDLGCAVGRSSMELSATYESVLGIDFSEALIAAANQLKTGQTIGIEIADEGELTWSEEVAAPDHARLENISFQVGDACNLPEEMQDFDLVLMANLIDRLPDPMACLERLASLVSPEGILVITSPYTWMDEFTPRDKWLGGRLVDGQALRTFEALRENLRSSFTLLQTTNEPFLIREHRRKNQLSIAQASVWRRIAG